MTARPAETDDPNSPGYWMDPKRRIQPPKAPEMHSKLSCQKCKEGTAYSDGAGSYWCTRCNHIT